jgi:hypothetical protein
MQTHSYKFGHIDPWWDDSFKQLDFQYLPIKNTFDEDRWRGQGYVGVTLNGMTVNMPTLEKNMPEYAVPFLTMFDWDHVTINYYCQRTLNMFPLHYDSYLTYRKLYNIEDPSKIWRCIVFLEDWKSGHYFEIDGQGFVNWKRGDYVVWNNNTSHFAANIGIEPRYTMQITGVERI